MASYAELDCDTERRRKADGASASTGDSKAGSLTAVESFVAPYHPRNDGEGLQEPKPATSKGRRSAKLGAIWQNIVSTAFRFAATYTHRTVQATAGATTLAAPTEW
jgi:hypothetical protein